MPPSQIRASSNVRPSNGVGAAIVVVVEVVVVDEVVDSIVDGSVTT
jgi:glucan biosynthesis protein